jgi:uncharacterized protein
LGRIVLLLIIAFLVYLVFRGFFRANTRKPAQPPEKTVVGEDMVTCARCGVNLPKSDARLKEGVFYCQENPRCKAP